MKRRVDNKDDGQPGSSTRPPPPRKNSSSNDSTNDFVNEKELMKSIHYGVMKAAEEVSEEIKDRGQMEFNPELISRISSLTWSTFTDDWVTDVLAFSGHAGRSTVNSDDVGLIMRRNPALTSLVYESSGVAQNCTKKPRGPKRKTKGADGKDENRSIHETLKIESRPESPITSFLIHEPDRVPSERSDHGNSNSLPSCSASTPLRDPVPPSFPSITHIPRSVSGIRPGRLQSTSGGASNRNLAALMEVTSDTDCDNVRTVKVVSRGQTQSPLRKNKVSEDSFDEDSIQFLDVIVPNRTATEASSVQRPSLHASKRKVTDEPRTNPVPGTSNLPSGSGWMAEAQYNENDDEDSRDLFSNSPKKAKKDTIASISAKKRAMDSTTPMKTTSDSKRTGTYLFGGGFSMFSFDEPLETAKTSGSATKDQKSTESKTTVKPLPLTPRNNTSRMNELIDSFDREDDDFANL